MPSVVEKIQSGYVTSVTVMTPNIYGIYFVTLDPRTPKESLFGQRRNLRPTTTKIIVRVSGTAVTVLGWNPRALTDPDVSQADFETFAMNAVRRHLQVTDREAA